MKHSIFFKMPTQYKAMVKTDIILMKLNFFDIVSIYNIKI